MPRRWVGGTHLERRQQLAAPLPDGFVVLGAVLFVPVALLEYPTQDRELTPAPRAQGNERSPGVPAGVSRQGLGVGAILGSCRAPSLQRAPA